MTFGTPPLVPLTSPGSFTYSPARAVLSYHRGRLSRQLIFPSYDRLKEAGLLGSKPPTKPNFFAARILADEALASKVR